MQTGVFTLAQLDDVYQQALDTAVIDQFYFEGGESFIYHPILVKAVARATVLGFWTGVVTNGYWVTGYEDAMAWLRPLADAGLDQISISCDAYHGDSADAETNHPGLAAAQKLGISAGAISIEPPQENFRDPDASEPGEPVIGGDVMFRGRAATALTDGLPRQPWDSFTRCPYENLADPGRVHLDPFGYLHLCQGISMGNLFKRPLTKILQEYDPHQHPIVAPLLAGGPAKLAQQYDLPHEEGYVDACHFCYTAREMLRGRFPNLLAPDQMYGDRINN